MTDNKKPINISVLKKYFKPSDIILTVMLFLLAAILGITAIKTSPPSEQSVSYAVIKQDGKELARLELSRDCEYVISVGSAHNTVTVSDGTVYMSSADCPDELCVSSGGIDRPGQMIVCLPNRVVVTIEAEGGGRPDAIAY